MDGDKSNLLDLPDEMIEEILDYLSWTDLQQVHTVRNKRLRTIAKSIIDRYTTLLISTGNCGYSPPYSKESFILKLSHLKDPFEKRPFGEDTKSISEKAVDYPHEARGCFAMNCEGKVIIGGGAEEGRSEGGCYHMQYYLNKVYLFDSNKYIEVESLNHFRPLSCGVVYRKHFIVSGGLNMFAQKSMEVLHCDKNLKTNKWELFEDSLPIALINHQVNILNDRIVLTGGINQEITYQSNGELIFSNKVWEGIVSFKPKFNIKWTKLPSMLERRSGHVAVVINNTIYCIGGEAGHSSDDCIYLSDLYSSEYLSKDKKTWKWGPSLRFTLVGAKGTVDNASQQCIITGGNRNGEPSNKISLFNPINGLRDIGESNRSIYDHVAVIL